MTPNILTAECTSLGWYKMEQLKAIRNVPFGVYGITKPLSKKPDDSIRLYDFNDTVYVGMAGKSYETSDFYHDKKRSGNNSFWMQSKLYKRLNSHRKNLIASNPDKKREAAYKVFHENFGSGKELMKHVYFSVLVPSKNIESNLIRTWLSFIESAAIYQYACNFDDPPLMQLAHMVDVGNCMIRDDSYCQQRKKSVEQSSLTRFLA